MSDSYDDAYLFSADGDFSYVVEAVRETGRKVFVASPGECYHLAQTADAYIHLTHDRLVKFLRTHGGP